MFAKPLFAPLSRWTWTYLGFVAFSLLGSLLSRATHLDPGPIAPISSFLTLGLGTAAIFAPAFQEDKRRAAVSLAALLLLGAVVEYVGVSTGVPFGRYAYTDRWVPVAPLSNGGFFPLQVPFAWALVVGAAAGSFHRSVLLGAVVAAALDLAMEPVMAGPLHYWHWVTPGPMPGGAPVLNTVGWFFTALAGALIIRNTGPNSSQMPPNARAVLIGHFVLTAGLGAIMTFVGR